MRRRCTQVPPRSRASTPDSCTRHPPTGIQNTGTDHRGTRDGTAPPHGSAFRRGPRGATPSGGSPGGRLGTRWYRAVGGGGFAAGNG